MRWIWLMGEDILSVIYLLLVVALVFPGFYYANKNKKVFLKNLIIWIGIIGILVIFDNFEDNPENKTLLTSFDWIFVWYWCHIFPSLSIIASPLNLVSPLSKLQLVGFSLFGKLFEFTFFLLQYYLLLYILLANILQSIN